MNETDIDYCMEVRNSCLQIHPRLMNLTPGSDPEPGVSVVTYPAEIESEVDSIYKQMYDEHTTIDDVIALLQRSKMSANPRDHEIFSCMLHFLFDEYKFFQSFYPPRELAMTAYLFGSLIQHQLVDYIPLGIAIRYIIDALKCPPDSNLFKFGIQALSRFESRLSEWQPLCQALLQIPLLAEARPDLIATIHRAIAAGNEVGSNADLHNHAPGSTSASAEVPPPPFTAIQPDRIDGLLESPPEDVSDRILFLVNNLAPSNYDSKVAEMQQQFRDEYARWFANYLVEQRVSTEPNNQKLYLRFLDSLGSASLFKFVLQETLVKAAAMLNAERTMQSNSDRAILKNVGLWLGTITLARDRPIKHKNLSFKDLLVEGHDSGRLIIAIPFICKTLEPCAQSKVFKPPNPWLMAVLSLLAELYHFADLNRKFEIEVLCGVLGVDLDSVEASTIVRNRPSADPPGGPGLPEYPSDIDSLPIGSYDPTATGAASHLQNEPQSLAIGPANPADTHRAMGAHIDSILATLVLHVVISPQLGPVSQNSTYKQAVQLAIHRAVREVVALPYDFPIYAGPYSDMFRFDPSQIIMPVVERSVTIAGISTKELVAKDFVTEPNEDKLRKAGHLMAQKLAGSLALVTCKEPLKSNLTLHLRQYLADQGYNEVRLYLPLFGLFFDPQDSCSKWFPSKVSHFSCRTIWTWRAPQSKKPPWRGPCPRSMTPLLPPTMPAAATAR
jgi:CCR4-NOT transcription complex subunit 1